MVPPLDFDNTMRKTGTLAELVAALSELAEGWFHQGRADRAADAIEGARQLAVDAKLATAEQLRAGDCAVQVGHTLYVVTDI
jgi:hypothetical protein